MDRSSERRHRGRGTAQGEDLARGERLLGRFREAEDARVEEPRVEEGLLVGAGVGPGEVAGGETAESPGLVAAGQLAGPCVEGCGYVGEVQREGGEDQAVAGGGVPRGGSCQSLWLFFSDLSGRRSETLHGCEVVAEDRTEGMADVDDLGEGPGYVR